jgi:hypothetical protein
MEELLEVVFSVQSILRLYQESAFGRQLSFSPGANS